MKDKGFKVDALELLKTKDAASCSDSASSGRLEVDFHLYLSAKLDSDTNNERR